MEGKRVGLALGSGGARGYAHIGVIAALLERGYEVAAVSGSSIGSLIGGLYAGGALQTFTDWVLTLTKSDIVRMLDPVLGAPGAFRLQRITQRISDMLGGVKIEDLPIPFTAVATDLRSRREVWFQRGPIDVAIRASVAIPTVITPIVLNGRLLVDGGVLNPVPLEPLNTVPTDLTVAVSLLGQSGEGIVPVAETASQKQPNELLDRLRGVASGVMENELLRGALGRFAARDSEAPEVPFDQPPSHLSFVDVSAVSLEVMGAMITRFRMAAHPPDVLITVPSNACFSLDFHRAAEMVDLGRELADAALDAYEDVRPAVPAPPPRVELPAD